MNICADCKYAQRIETRNPGCPVLMLCNAPQNEAGIDEVTGVKLYRAHRCYVQRESRLFFHSKYCGPDAKWWEPK